MNSNISTSECSSGCESGWTLYWDQLSDSRYTTHNNFSQNYQGKGSAPAEQEYEDDESMVSDASSGPRLYMLASDSASGSQDKKTSNKKKKKQQQPQFWQLDDTATSPAFHFYQDNVESPRPPPPPRPPHDQNQYKSVDQSMPKKRLGFFKAGSKKRG